MRKIISIFCLLFLVGSMLNATNYYVAQNDPNASDSNPGTEALPFETIQAAADVAQAGDVVYVKAGTYRETVIPANSGTAGNPIVYKPYGNDEVIISGTEYVTGWTNAGIPGKPNIYKAPLPTHFMPYEQGHSDQIFVDGQMMLVARWPNTSLNISYPKKALTTSADRTDKFVHYEPWGEVVDSVYGEFVTADPIPSIDYTGAHVYFQPDTGKWTWGMTGRIRSASGNDVSFVSRNGGDEDGSSSKYVDISRYYLCDALGLLDKEGECFHDQETGELYLWAPGGVNPNSVNVEARKRMFAFDLSDKSYIEIRGFKLFASTITTDRLAGIDMGIYDEEGLRTVDWPYREKGSDATSHHIIMDGLDVEYPWHTLNHEHHFYMQYGQHSGIVLGGYDHVVKNCTIRYSAANGISCVGYRHKIINNVIEDVNYNGLGYAAIAFGGSGAYSYDHDIGYNTIRR